LRYGIDEVQFAWMQLRQDGLCAICRADVAKHIDHDHRTGRVRGLLCFHCNNGLGQFDDDPERIDLAVAYLRSHQGDVREDAQPYVLQRAAA